jgi:hypothetical protein
MEFGLEWWGQTLEPFIVLIIALSSNKQARVFTARACLLLHDSQLRLSRAVPDIPKPQHLQPSFNHCALFKVYPILESMKNPLEQSSQTPQETDHEPI